MASPVWLTATLWIMSRGKDILEGFKKFHLPGPQTLVFPPRLLSMSPPRVVSHAPPSVLNSPSPLDWSLQFFDKMFSFVRHSTQSWAWSKKYFRYQVAETAVIVVGHESRKTIVHKMTENKNNCRGLEIEMWQSYMAPEAQAHIVVAAREGGGVKITGCFSMPGLKRDSSLNFKLCRFFEDLYGDLSHFYNNPEKIDWLKECLDDCIIHRVYYPCSLPMCSGTSDILSWVCRAVPRSAGLINHPLQSPDTTHPYTTQG